MLCENGSKVPQRLKYQYFLCVKRVKSTVQKKRSFKPYPQDDLIHN